MVRRGELWWAAYPQPAGRRPVVIVQSDRFNQSGIATVIAVPLTTTLRLADAPGNVRLSRRESGLRKDSVVNVSQVGVLRKDALAERIGLLSGAIVTRIEDGLRLVLDLSR